MSSSAASSPPTESAAVLTRGLRTPALCLLFVASVSWTAASPIGTPSHWSIFGQALVAGATVHLLGRALQRRWPATLALATLAIGVGAWRAGASLDSAAEPWADAPRTRISARATVDGPTETRGAIDRVNLRIDRLDRPEGLATPAGLIQITVPALSSFERGDLVEISARVDPVDRSSSYGSMLLRQGIGATARFPDVLPVGQADTAPPTAALEQLRATLQRTIERMLPQPHAALVAGLLLGSSSGMPDAFRTALIASGTSHIVVVSGYNITVVAGMLTALFRGHRALALLIPLIGLWAFTLFVGASPPAVRAAIMATTFVVAQGTGRRTDSLAALALTTALMCLIDPSLPANLGFQLSALATLGLILLAPRLAGLISWVHPWLREPIATTLAAMLATAPVQTAAFHQMSAAAPLANVLVAPLVPVITIAAGIGVPLATVASGAAPVIGALLVAPAHLVVMAIELCAAIPGAVVPAGEMPGALLVTFVAGLIAWAAAGTPEGRDLVTALRASTRVRTVAPAGAAVLAAVLLAGSAATAAPPPLTLTVLDVGQGDAVLIRTPGGRTVLVDGGPNPSALLQQLGRRMGLFEHNLSVVILTQADPERLPGALTASERYAPALAVGPPEGSTSALYERWTTVAPQTLQITSPTTIQLENNVSLELAPTGPVPGIGRGAGTPRRALLARIVHGEVVVLIAPSVTASAAQQTALESGISLRANGLYVPRHGEKEALSSGLLTAVDPQVALFSVAARNRDDLPAKATLDLLAAIPIHRTDLHGALELRSDGVNVTVTRERDRR